MSLMLSMGLRRAGQTLRDGAPVFNACDSQAVSDNLWLHFTRMAGYEPPVIVRGNELLPVDATARRYLDALAGPSA